jgi:iron complex outermembrane receptor protein
MSTPFRKVQVLNDNEFRNFIKDYGKNIGEDLSDQDYGSSVNWFNRATRRPAYSQSHYLSLSGGSTDNNYRISLNYRNRNGTLKYTGFKGINARVQLNQSALDNRLNLSVNLFAKRRSSNFGFPQAFYYATIYNPTQPVRSKGFPEFGNYYQLHQTDYFNPVAIINQDKNIGKKISIDGDVTASYRFSKAVPGLSVSGLYSERHSKFTGGEYYPSVSLYGNGQAREGLADRSYNGSRSNLIRITTNYKKTISSHINFKLLSGYSWQSFTNNGFRMSGGGFITDHFGFNNLGAAKDFGAGLGTVNSFKNDHKLISIFGRINFNYNETYLLSGSVRREGSSRFGADNKWGTFYGVSGGIILTGLLNIPHVQNLKIRGGYGVSGNDAPGSYLSKLRYQPSNYFVLNGTPSPTYVPASTPNPDLRWEKKKEFDIGLNFSIFNDKLKGKINFYSNKTKDLLLNFPVPVPPNIYSTEWLNIGELSNKGLEVSFNINAFRSKTFSWETSIKGTHHIRTKIVSLSSKKLQFGSRKLIANMGSPGMNNTLLIRVKEGHPVGEIWGPIFEGITKDGHWKLKDLNGDGKIGKEDNTVIGNGQPNYMASWSNNFHYRNWDLNFSLRGIFGHDLINSYRTFYQNPSGVTSHNVLKSTLDIKRLVDPPTFSSFDVEKASFVQLNNVGLGYTFQLPAPYSSLQISLIGHNLFYITNYNGPDPEPRYSDGGNPLAPGIARRGTYFSVRSFSLNVSLKL